MRRTVIDVSAMDLRNAKRAAVIDLDRVRASLSASLGEQQLRQAAKVVSQQARKRVRT